LEKAKTGVRETGNNYMTDRKFVCDGDIGQYVL